MRVALVQCPPWGSLPPLGTAALKAYLEPHGHPTRCFDLNIDYCHERELDLLEVGGSVYARPDPSQSGAWEEWTFAIDDGEIRFGGSLDERPLPVERWVDEVLASEPGLVGFSVQSTNLGVTLQVANVIRRRDPSIRIVFGGPNVAEAQQGAMALLTRIPDLVVEGEGEATLLELVERYDAGEPVDDVAGIGRLVDGQPTWTERRALLGQLDALPFPDFSDVDWTRYPNPYEIPIMASRGCVLNCAFCYETVYWKRFRTQGAARVVAEIEHQIAVHPLRGQVENGPVRFGMSFADSLVNGHLGGLRRMAELMVERDVDVYWNGQATINTKMDDEYLGILSASGCTGLSFGLESASQSVLESMGKRFQIDEATAFFDRVHRSGIELFVNIMVGFPTETRADFVETLRFLTSIRRMVSMVNNVGSTAVVGGSRLQRDPEQFGITPIDPSGWQAGTNFSWTAKGAGSAKERELRVRALHAWMSLMRIPHQRMGPARKWPWTRWWADRAAARSAFDGLQAAPVAAVPDGRDDGVPVAVSSRRAASPPSDAERTARIEALTAEAGHDPLLLSTTAGVVHEVLAGPDWAAGLDLPSWPGTPLKGLERLVTPLLGPELRFSQQHRPQGVTEVHVLATQPPEGSPGGLLAAHFPTSADPSSQVIAVFPLRRARRVRSR